jgi:predicted DNA-binding transcriptional regulator YafY
MFKKFGSAIDKIVDRVTISSHPDDKDISQFVQFETALSSGGNEYLPEILNAIRNGLMIRFDYTSFVSGQSKLRSVSPLLLKEYRNRWYLISFDQEKKDIITYGLDRMRELTLTEEKSTVPVHFDAAAYFRYAYGITANNKTTPETIVFSAQNVAAKYIETQPFHDTQQVTNRGDRATTFEVTLLPSEELIRNILSYAGEIEVVLPLSLREEIIRRLRGMNAVYSVQ